MTANELTALVLFAGLMMVIAGVLFWPRRR